MEDLKNEKIMLAKQNNDMLSELQSLKLQLEEARNEANLFKGKFTNASHEIEMSQLHAGRASTEAQLQAEECVTLRRQLHDL